MFDDLTGRKLLVLGGTRISCEIITAAQEMGIFVGVADYNPLGKSPGKQIANAIHDVSVIDIEKVVSLINQEGYEGVLTGFSDMLLPYYAEICSKANLPCYGTKDQFELLINKSRYKSLCRDYGVPTVDEYSISIDSFEEDVQVIDFPVVVKPTDSSGFKGISFCHSPGELREGLQKALGSSRTNSVLVERYLEGKEVTVFWIFQDGQYHLTMIGNRIVKAFPETNMMPLPVAYTFPSAIIRGYKETIEMNAKEMFKNIGITDGMMFMQCKIERGVCHVYDLGFRLTGSLEYRVLERKCGFNPLKMLIHHSLTGKMSNTDISEFINPEFDGYAFNASILSKPGIIGSISGLDEIESLPEVVGVVLNHLPSEEITDEMKGLLSQIVVRVLGVADNKNQLYSILKEVGESISIKSNAGEEMKLTNLRFEEIVADLI